MRMVAVLSSFLGGILGAQVSWSAVNIQNFSHSNSYGFESLNSLLVDDSDVPVVKNFLLTAGWTYNAKPLVMKNVDNTVTVRNVVDNYHAFHLGGGSRLAENWFLGFQTALVSIKPTNQNSAWTVADSQLQLNWTFFRRPNFALGLIPFLTLPTGDTTKYLSDSGLGGGALLLSQYNLGLWNFVTGLGYRNDPKAQDEVDPNFQWKNRWILEAGLFRRLSQKWVLLAEYKREPKIPVGEDLNPNELFVGARYSRHPDWAWFMGVGSGDLTSSTTGDYRLHAGVKFAPQAKRKKLVCELRERDRELFKISLGFANAEADPNTRELVESLLAFVEKNRPIIARVRVVGHTSAPGSSEFNQGLSERRAKSVTAKLIKAGLPAELMQSEGKGEQELLDKQWSEVAHGVNRRVEAIVERKPERYEVCEEKDQ